VNGVPVLHLVVMEVLAVLQLLAVEDEPLKVGSISLQILYLHLEALNRVVGVNPDSGGLAEHVLDKDLDILEKNTNNLGQEIRLKETFPLPPPPQPLFFLLISIRIWSIG
jgi:hypothetical protein